MRQQFIRTILETVFLSIFLFTSNGCRKTSIKETAGVSTADSSRLPSTKVVDDVKKDLPNTTPTIPDTINNNISSKIINISGVFLGDSVSVLERLLGKPDSIVRSVNEYNGDTVYLYYLKSSIFEVVNNKVDGFNITDRQNVFTPGHIKVGDNDDKIRSQFPLPYQERYELEDSIQVVKVSINNSDEYILFKLKNKKVINFSTWINW